MILVLCCVVYVLYFSVIDALVFYVFFLKVYFLLVLDYFGFPFFCPIKYIILIPSGKFSRQSRGACGWILKKAP